MSYYELHRQIEEASRDMYDVEHFMRQLDTVVQQVAVRLREVQHLAQRLDNAGLYNEIAQLEFPDSVSGIRPFEDLQRAAEVVRSLVEQTRLLSLEESGYLEASYEREVEEDPDGPQASDGRSAYYAGGVDEL